MLSTDLASAMPVATVDAANPTKRANCRGETTAGPPAVVQVTSLSSAPMAPSPERDQPRRGDNGQRAVVGRRVECDHQQPSR